MESKVDVGEENPTPVSFFLTTALHFTLLQASTKLNLCWTQLGTQERYLGKQRKKLSPSKTHIQRQFMCGSIEKDAAGKCSRTPA